MSLNTKLGDASQDSYVSVAEASTYFSTRRETNNWDTLSSTNREVVLKQAARDMEMFSYINDPYYDNQGLHFPNDDHDVITGNCATPVTINSFKNTSFTSDTYGTDKSNTNYWKYGSIHITSATPLHDVRVIDTSNITTDVVVMTEDFTATPTTNTKFIAFEPLHKDIKHAQMEQALYILDNANMDTLQMYKGSGAESVKIGDVTVKFKEGAMSGMSFSPVARKFLGSWIKRFRKVLRG